MSLATYGTEKEPVWLIIVAVFGCLFIVKRIYFSNEQNRLKKGDPLNGFIDIIQYILVCFILVVFVYGPENKVFLQVFKYILIFVLIIGGALLLKWLFGLLINPGERTRLAEALVNMSSFWYMLK
jgi:hypothetical protein